MKNTDIAWASGFFDGEGSISFKGNSIRLQISQKIREPLDKFVAIFGLGKACGYRGKYKYQDYSYYGIAITGESAIAILRLMQPYLTVKKAKALDAIYNRKYLYNRDPKRLHLVKLLHARGHSFTIIGKMLGVSRQRAHQLYLQQLTLPLPDIEQINLF